uniref:MARVEL domain-containing protein n=1 Tax=Steinernema glaseri TaxID=37863 RepID=A0A1I8A5L1_9BILA
MITFKDDDPQLKMDLNRSYRYRTFEHRKPEYMCCCGTIHVQNGALQASAAAIALSLIALIALAMTFEVYGVHMANVLCTVMDLVVIFGAGMIIHGVRTEAEEFLVPALIMAFAFINSEIVAMAMMVWTVLAPQNVIGKYIASLEIIDGNSASIRLFSGASALAIFLLIFATVWFLRVTYRCYTYFAHWNAARLSLIIGSEPIDV